MRHIPAFVPLLAIAVVLVTLVGPATPPAVAQSGAAPATCRVGAYLTALHAFDPEADTFDADMWLWSVCPAPERRPLETMEFVNAYQVQVLLDVRESPIWANRKVQGTFRHDWDERNFPFDRHTLRIELEEGAEDVRRFVYEPDTANSGVDPTIHLPGWTMTDFTLLGSARFYDTTFGDPDLPAGGSSEYSRLTVTIGLMRADLSGFFKLTAVVYAAFVLSLISYVMHLESTTAISPQVGLLAAALFAAAVNLVTASGALGSSSGLTLVDKIHVLVLVYILVAAVVAVLSRVLVERGWTAVAVARLNRRAGVLAAGSFVAVNALLIGAAARGG